MTAGALLLASVLGISALQVAVEPGGLTVRVPVRGAPGVPEVRSADGEIVVEVPDGKLDRASTALLEGDGARRLPIQEVSATTSRSRHRGVLALRLREGAALPAERVSAQISQGVLTVRVTGEPGAAGAAGVAGVAPAAGAARTAAPPPISKAAPTGAAATTRGTASGESPRGALVPARSPADLALRALPFLAGLAVVAWLLLRQRAGKLGRPGQPGQRGELRPSAINIVATRVLGRSQRLMVVDVDRRRFLLSASDAGGVALLSPIEAGAALAGAAVEAPAAAAARGKDGLDAVFADMLQDLTGDKAATAGAPPAGQAPQGADARAAAPAPRAPGAPRPVLQLVDDEPEGAAPARAAAPPPPARRPVTEEIPAREAPLRASAGRAVSAMAEAGPGSADVAGLLALRQGRASGMKGVAR